MSRFLYRLVIGAVRRRRLVVAAWLVLLVVLAVAGPALGGKLSDNFTVSGVDSRKAQNLLTSKFASEAGSSAQVVVHAHSGTLTAGADQAELAATMAAIKALPRVVAVSDSLSTRERAERKRVSTMPADFAFPGSPIAEYQFRQRPLPDMEFKTVPLMMPAPELRIKHQPGCLTNIYGGYHEAVPISNQPNNCSSQLPPR